MTRSPLRRPSTETEADLYAVGRRHEDWLGAETETDERRSFAQRPRKPTAAPVAPRQADYGILVEATAASERRAIDTAAKTADALGSVASWIERAQAQLDETRQTAVRVKSDTASALDDAVDRIGRRLEEMENRFESRSSAEESRYEQAFGREAASKSEFDDALKGLETRLAELGDKVASAPRPVGRRSLAEVDGAVAEIRNRQTALDRNNERAILPALGTLARSQTAILTSLKADVSRLAERLDDTAPRRAADLMREEVETIRGSMARVATRDDLGRLERSIESLTGDIAELRDSGQRSGVPDGMEALHREIQRLAAANSEAGQGVAARDMELISSKLDIVAASGVDPVLLNSLSRQVDDVREMLAGAAGPQAVSLVTRHLADLQREISAIGGRQIEPGEFSALKRTVEEMRIALAEAGDHHPVREPSPQAAIEAIEPLLSNLVDRIDRVERRVSDPEALRGLERQIETLATRIGQGFGSRDPAIAALERSVGTLLGEAASWREGAVEAADRAARSAVDELIGAMPKPVDVERHLIELREHYDAADERTFQSLEAVHAAIETAMSRINSLEREPARPAIAPSAFAPPPAPRAEAAPPPPPMPQPARTAPAGRRDPIAESFEPLPPAREDEILLEPGAARPAPPRRPAAPVAQEPSQADIKQSFIAAARRAAQAAVDETTPKAAIRTRPSGVAKAAGSSRQDLAARIRKMIGERRRSLLLSAAALVLALGTAQMVRNLTPDATPEPSRVARVAPEPAPRAPQAVASIEPKPAGIAAPAISASPALPPGVPDPVTTESITPRGGSAPPAATIVADIPSKPAGDKAADTARIPPAPAAVTASIPPANAQPAGQALQPGLKQAALGGDPVALYELGARSFEGRGVGRDQKAAAGMFEKAAEKGLAPAQYRIGNMYERGMGVERNIETAKSWYRRAAEAGNVRAMHNLAVLLAEGTSGKSDYQGALGWFTRAADRGVKDSQFNLAVLYARGLGTTQDLSKAYLWLSVVAQQGDEDAGKKRDEVGGRLSAADLAKAKLEVAKWQPMPVTAAANEVHVPAAGWPEAPVKRASRTLNL